MVEVQKKEMSQSEIWKLAIEIWKLEKRLKKIETLSDEDVKATSFLLNRMYKIIEGYDVQLVDYTGQKFLEGMAWIDILSAETDKDIDFPIIWETMTPLVIIWWKIDQRSKVVIKTPENVVEEVKEKELDKQYKQFTHNKWSLNLIIKIISLLLILLSLVGITWFILWKLSTQNNEEILGEEKIEEEINSETEINNETEMLDESLENEYIEEEGENYMDNEVVENENLMEENNEKENQMNENMEEQNIVENNIEEPNIEEDNSEL